MARIRFMGDIKSRFPTGFLMWKDRKCGHCGHQEGGDEPAYKLDCPDCGRDGCADCMPMGRGCTCPECEEAIEESVDG